MTLVPPSDRVLCRLVEPETHTQFGLELPEIAQETPLRATVLAVGDGTPHAKFHRGRIPLGCYVSVPGHLVERRRGSELVRLELQLASLQPGDEVILPGRGGSEIVTADGETVISILASEILARAEG